MSPGVVGALVGLLGGLGLTIVVLRLRSRRISLDQRLAPYLRPQTTSSGLLRTPSVRGPFATVERLVAPVMTDAVRLVTRLGSPTVELRRRLSRAGRTETVEQFRAGQVVWGVLGLAAGLALALVLAATRGSAVLALVVLVAICGLLGVLRARLGVDAGAARARVADAHRAPDHRRAARARGRCG